MKRSIKIQLLNMLVQTVPVVLGIFLAIYINQNQEVKKDRLYVKSLIDKAKEKIIQDSTLLTHDIASHSKLIKLFDEIMDNEKMSIKEIFIQSSGINVTPVNVNYLQMLVNSKMEYIQVDQSSEIFQILDFVKAKERYEEMIQTTIYEDLNSYSKEVKQKLKMIFEDYAALEERLFKSQKRFLKW